MTSKYEETGVDPKKEGIEVFKDSIDNLFPEGFCTVSRDPDSEGQGMILHTDGAGSKPVQNYLNWRESGDVDWFKSIGQDVVAMNVDDLVCVGGRSLAFVDYIALNKSLLPKKEILATLNSGFRESLEMLEDYGMEISFLGGETADLPDQLKTLDVSGTIYGRADISEAITGEDIEPGDEIVGLRSGGKTEYEDEENSGLMCNGITLARHSLMKGQYEEKYPEIGGAGDYYGSFSFDDYHEELGMTVGGAIVSPTRIYAPVIKEILEEFRPRVKGMVHNTGGGQTKCLGVGNNIHYVKDDPIEVDPLFRIIKEESGESWRDMFRDFNMGTGFEIIAEEGYAEDILSVSEKFDLEGKVIGKCEKGNGENSLKIKSEFGEFEYEE